MLKSNYSIFKQFSCTLVFAIVSMCSFAGLANSESSFQSATKIAVITVPDGQIMHAITTTPINSKFVEAGQTVTMVLGRDFCYNSKMVAPVDSMLYGTIIRVTKHTNSKPAEVILRFNQLVTPYGIQIPVSAIVKTKDNAGKIVGTNSKYSDANGNVDIPVATNIDLILTQPITVNPEVYNSNY